MINNEFSFGIFQCSNNYALMAIPTFFTSKRINNVKIAYCMFSNLIVLVASALEHILNVYSRV